MSECFSVSLSRSDLNRVYVVNGVEYGRGEGDSKDAAKEAAAHVAYLQVLSQLQGRRCESPQRTLGHNSPSL